MFQLQPPEETARIDCKTQPAIARLRGGARRVG